MSTVRQVSIALAIASGLATAASAQTLTPTQLKRLTERAEAGEAPAMALLGDLYLDGDGIPKDEAAARRWLSAAADKGHAQSALRLALEPDTDLAAKRELLTKAADSGMVVAFGQLALTYTRGADGSPDYRKAAELFRQAADKGSADAAYRLGLSYHFGRGVPSDAVEADRWMRIAAALDFPDAQSWLRDPGIRYGDKTADERAAASALADRLIAEAKAGDALVNATSNGVAIVRHAASGLSCEVTLQDKDYRISIERDGAVICRRAGVELRAQPARPGATAQSELAAFLTEEAKDRRLTPAHSPIPQSPGTRFAEGWFATGTGFVRLNAGVIDGWSFRERINGGETFWPDAAAGGSAYSVLDHAAPLPKAQPAIAVMARPVAYANQDDGPPPALDLIRAQVAQCTTTGAFGETFGVSEVKGRPRSRIVNSWQVHPDPEIPGVHELEVVLTDKSDRIHSVNASTIRYRDKAALKAAVAVARAEALRLGWIETDGSEAEQTFKFAHPGPDGKPVLELEVGEGLGDFTVTCRDVALFAQAVREFTNEVRVTERPRPPVVPASTPRHWAADCSDAGLQRVILRTALDQSRVRMSLGSAWDRYYNTLSSWKIGVIAERARFTKAQKDELTLRSAVSGMENGFASGLASLGQGIEDMIAMEEALQANDYRTACRNAVGWLDATDGIVSGNGSQWRTMQEVLDAEAKRRGVTFGE